MVIVKKKAVCPQRCGCESFVTVAHVSQDWLVDPYGEFIEVRDECNDVLAHPDKGGNIWVCDKCGAEAEFHEE